MATTIYTHPLFYKHETPENHPECPARYKVLQDALKDFPQITPDQDQDVTDLILKAHTKNHLALLEESIIEDEITPIDAHDTFVSTHSLDAAMHAVTNICTAINDVKQEKTKHAFCLSRPPGHHAEPNKAMGFCLLNTAFIGALHAQTIGFDRVAILDFDVHHGNGTDAMMQKHTPHNMLFISSHEEHLFTKTGYESTDTVHNHTLPPHSGSKEMRATYQEKIFPALKRFDPNLIILSAGFDAHENDPYANLNWTTDDYAWLGTHLSPYKTVSTLEGGYNLTALKDSVLGYINALEK